MKNEENNKKCGIYKISPFERNNYFYGKLLTVKDYQAEQTYFNEKRWLINRMVNGSGVVCGLDVVRDGDKVCIEPGMAIDSCGREIVVYDTQTVELNFEKDECADCVENTYVICIKYHKCEAEPLEILPIKCEGDGKSQYNRIRDSFKISIKCYQEAECDEISPVCPLENKTESLHNYICDAIRHKECTECEECNCVILAKVTVSEDGTISIDNCSDRPLVYSNPMLYEMLECFHGGLPHITNIGWQDFHAKEDVAWEDFITMFDANSTLITIKFDKPMLAKTINEYTCLFAAITVEESTGYRRKKYIPLVFNDTEEYIEEIKINVEQAWIGDEIEGGHSEIKNGADFEITLRGSSIMSKDGKALDGNFIGGKTPSGNGMQGGDFVSWFRVTAPAKTNAKKQTRRK